MSQSFNVNEINVLLILRVAGDFQCDDMNDAGGRVDDTLVIFCVNTSIEYGVWFG